jgi:DNA-binding CsgD family transcriptional regulator
MHAFIPLTHRQYEILALIAEGKKDREIADCTGLRLQTVRNYVSSIEHELGVTCRASVAVYALTGYLPPDSEERRRERRGQMPEEAQEPWWFKEIDFTARALVGGFQDGY